MGASQAGVTARIYERDCAESTGNQGWTMKAFKKGEFVIINGESLDLSTFGTGNVRCQVVQVQSIRFRVIRPGQIKRRCIVRIRDPKRKLWWTPANSLRR